MRDGGVVPVGSAEQPFVCKEVDVDVWLYEDLTTLYLAVAKVSTAAHIPVSTCIQLPATTVASCT
jgi:hypothetical protein